MSGYYVTFRESAIVTEYVEARSKAEAIRLVKDGQGERVDFVIDETRNPTDFQAGSGSLASTIRSDIGR